jgi:hypothetical protein
MRKFNEKQKDPSFTSQSEQIKKIFQKSRRRKYKQQHYATITTVLDLATLKRESYLLNW